MKLSDLIDGLDARRIGADVEVRGVQEDSRAVKPGELFVALPGRTVDGRKFAAAAVAAGAAAVLAEAETEGLAAAQVVVPAGRAAAALAVVAGRLAGLPAERMQLIGITGTNGKTTTTFLVEAMLAAAGSRPGVIGTVNYRFGDVVRPAPFTTPTPVLLQGVFAEMAAAGVSHVVMEVSSHALALDRLEGVRYRVAAFTNLTQDHLDLHGTMAEYEAAKRRLFDARLAPGGVAVAMIDGGPAGAHMLAAARGRRIACSIVQGSYAASRGEASPGADVAVARVAYSIEGIDAAWQTPRGELALRSRLLGEFNLSNLTLAVGIGEALELPHEVVSRGLESVRGVPGRLDRVEPGGDYAVLVDYAHTPDALERAMAALRPLTRGRLIVVFGCGGDRDRTKRPLMGRAVARDADLGVVTSDNPRTEDPLSILDMIRVGVVQEPVREVAADALGGAERGAFTVVPDRREAIGCAVRAARAGDVVLIAGKGHEDYQILGKTKIHFDDKEEAAAAMEERA